MERTGRITPDQAVCQGSQLGLHPFPAAGPAPRRGARNRRHPMDEPKVEAAHPRRWLAVGGFDELPEALR